MEVLPSLIQIGLAAGKETAKTLYAEVVTLQLAVSPQQQENVRARSSHNQEELLQAYLQWQLDILDAHSPKRVLSKMFGDETHKQLMADAQKVIATQQALNQIAGEQLQQRAYTPLMFSEPRAFVNQQAQGVKSAIGLPIPAIQAELSSFTAQNESVTSLPVRAGQPVALDVA